MSGLRQRTYGVAPPEITTLLAAPKPMFLGAAIRPTSGNSRRTMAAVPSPEALSTTCTMVPSLAGWSRRERRQFRSSGSQRYEMITTSSRASDIEDVTPPSRF